MRGEVIGVQRRKKVPWTAVVGKCTEEEICIEDGLKR